MNVEDDGTAPVLIKVRDFRQRSQTKKAERRAKAEWAAVRVGFGRIVVSEIGAPNMLANII